MSESDIDLSSNELELERAFSALYILMGKPSAKEFGRLMGDRAENWVVRMRERRYIFEDLGLKTRLEQCTSGWTEWSRNLVANLMKSSLF